MNSIVRFNFNKNFVEKSTCKSHEQYIEPTKSQTQILK